MKLAIPHWRGRVSPVFDVAGRVLVVEIENGVEQARHDLRLDVEDPRACAARLAQTGADVLICGAISRSLEMAVSASGIDVIPQTCGELEEVIAAFTDGRLGQGAFLDAGLLRAAKAVSCAAPPKSTLNEAGSELRTP